MTYEKRAIIQQSEPYVPYYKHPSYMGYVADRSEYPVVENTNFYKGKQEKVEEKTAFTKWLKDRNKQKKK